MGVREETFCTGLDREALKVLQQLCAEGEKRLQSLAAWH